MAVLLETLPILKTIVWGAQPFAIPLLPKLREGNCPQLFVTEKKQNRKMDILIICFIAESFNPKNKFNLRPANVE